MSKDKHLTKKGWDDVAEKHKINETELKKALEEYEKLKEDEYGKRLTALDAIKTREAKLKDDFSTRIKEAKKYKAKPEVIKGLEDAVKYLSAVEEAADKERKEVEAKQQSADDAARAAKPPTLERLNDAAQEMSGATGSRVKKIMAIAMAHPRDPKFCWF